MQRLLQQRGRHVCIGRDEGEHRRHIRMDHAGAFGDAGNGDRCIADLNLPRDRLRHGIGGHDRVCSLQPVVRAQIPDALRQAS